MSKACILAISFGISIIVGACGDSIAESPLPTLSLTSIVPTIATGPPLTNLIASFYMMFLACFNSSFGPFAKEEEENFALTRPLYFNEIP